MCPLCITSITLLVGGGTSAAGLTLLAIRRRHANFGANHNAPRPKAKEASS